jgi:hypothetical protein
MVDHGARQDLYPTGRQGRARRWDGDVWTGPAVESPDAPETHAGRSFRRVLARAPFWCAVLGIVVGVTLALVGAALEERNVLLLSIGGLLATGGPILALVLGVHRRLGIGTLDARRATVTGVVSGAVALGVAIGLERAVGGLLGLEENEPDTLFLLLAGPIEEASKLLVPVVLLAAGAAFVRRPRLGVWAVLVASAVFGACEGAIYAAGRGPTQGTDPGEELTKAFPGMSETVADALAELVDVGGRIWVELGHPLWTTGAAVIIWVAVHERKRSFVLLAVGGYLAAAALHSFNDGVLTLLPGAFPVLASIVFITLSYVLWFRPLVRRLVPPDALGAVPARWTPPLPRSSGRHQGA